MRRTALVALLGALALGALALGAADLDGDGIDDKLEERLLKKFRPTLLIDKSDCDGRPAEFARGAARPVAGARNGTLYGQVFRHVRGLEIHYYHLWANDCGRGAHALDAEHVAVLLEPDGHPDGKNWHAVAWIAAGHEGTLCDRRHGARAEALDAVHRGATIWVSYGKHASFLNQRSCGGGCGGDRCDNPVTLPPGKLINLGEAARPMPGYAWIRVPVGMVDLASKMTSDFGVADLVAIVKAGEAVVSLSTVPRPAQAAILGGNAAVNGMAAGGRHTESALGTAGASVEGAMGTGYEKVKGSLERSVGRARQWWKRR